jgi:hypothetical protein
MSSHTPGVTSRSEKITTAIQILILIGMGGMAGAVSFVHVHEWTTANGQQSWVGWTNAMVTELLQIAGGLEVQRRKRHGQPVTFVGTVLVCAVVVSLVAQVSQAKPSPAGWVVAALPALGFLTVVKIVMTRTAVRVTPTAVTDVTADLDRAVTAVQADRPDRVTPGPDLVREVGPGGPDRTGPLDRDLDRVRVGPGHGPDLDPVTDPADPDRGPDRAATAGHTPTPLDLDLDLGPDRTRSDRDRVTVPATDPDLGADLDQAATSTSTTDQATGLTDLTAEFGPDLTRRGHQVLAELTESGVKVNRGTFAMHLRRSGQPIQTNAAGQLLRALQRMTA